MEEIKILNSGSEDLLLNIQENEIDIGIIGSLNMLENPNLRIKLVKKSPLVSFLRMTILLKIKIQSLLRN